MSPFLPEFEQVDPIWREELDKVWTGERPARDGATAFARRVEEHLNRLKAEGKL